MTGLSENFKIPGLSVAIVTHNEEQNIGDCLDSIFWSDDIIVVDDFSTDRTPEICKKYGVRFYQERWKGFAGQRNSAITKASNSWVLSMDADERIPIELAGEIAEKLAKNSDIVGYRIPYKNYFRGSWIRYGGWYPDYHLRLFRRDKGCFEEREIHEAPVLNGPIGEVKNPLIHLAYRDISHFARKMDSYSTLMARQYLKEGKRKGAWTGLTHGLFTFFSMFVLRRGFQNGTDGLILAYLYSTYTFLKYAKLGEILDSTDNGKGSKV